jgi:hypothetical protein
LASRRDFYHQRISVLAAHRIGSLKYRQSSPRRLDRAGDGNLPSGERSPDLWFDVNAFRSPADFTFGNAGRNILAGPGEKILDGAMRKEFTLIKEQKLEFRAEFFNRLNHPYFAQPDNFLAIPMCQVQFGLKYRFGLFTLREMNAVPSDDSRFLGSHC